MCEEAVVAVEERLSVQEVLVWLGALLVEQFVELLVDSVVSNVDDCQNGRLGFFFNPLMCRLRRSVCCLSAISDH
ncbi:hypothetical protein TELCIR_18695 [Teladorsagia circumcincta]|uniref:Uncharacterized protein n=1 Tax=Teladorsagia circumcincta TaxID=45464 RepID=A0A2G9TPA2_TELCI|nr:hypothetical protein TELCIR_18695 [Teladorsagia circumcincta]